MYPLLVQCAVRKAHRIRQVARRERNIMSVVETVVGSGKYTYEVHEDWAQVPIRRDAGGGGDRRCAGPRLLF